MIVASLTEIPSVICGEGIGVDNGFIDDTISGDDGISDFIVMGLVRVISYLGLSSSSSVSSSSVSLRVLIRLYSRGASGAMVYRFISFFKLVLPTIIISITPVLTVMSSN